MKTTYELKSDDTIHSELLESKIIALRALDACKEELLSVELDDELKDDLACPMSFASHTNCVRRNGLRILRELFLWLADDNDRICCSGERENFMKLFLKGLELEKDIKLIFS